MIDNGNGKANEQKYTALQLALQEAIKQGQKCNGEHICLECTKTYYCQSTAICRMSRDVGQCGSCWRKAQGFKI